MSGLWEKKKLRAKIKIQEASRSLFLKNGFDKTTTDAIADLAEVSVGTIYNHYKSKEEIFVDSLFGDTYSHDEKQEFIIPSKTTNIDTTYLLSMINQYLNQLVQYGKPILRELMKAGINSMDKVSSFLSHLEAQDWNLIEHMASILAIIEEDEGDHIMKAEMLYSILAFEFLRFIYEEDYSENTLFEKIEKKITIMLK